MKNGIELLAQASTSVEDSGGNPVLGFVILFVIGWVIYAVANSKRTYRYISTGTFKA